MVSKSLLVATVVAAASLGSHLTVSQPDPTKTPGEYLNEKHKNIYTKEYKLPISVSHGISKAPAVAKGGLIITYEEASGTYTLVPRGSKLGQGSKPLATGVYSYGEYQ